PMCGLSSIHLQKIFFLRSIDGTPPYACRDFRESPRPPSDTGNPPQSHRQTGTDTLHLGSAAEPGVGTRYLRHSGGRHWKGAVRVSSLAAYRPPRPEPARLP